MCDTKMDDSDNNRSLCALSLSETGVRSSLGYLIPQLLCCSRIPTLITCPGDKSLIQLLWWRHWHRDQMTAIHFTEIYTRSNFCGGVFSWCSEGGRGWCRNISLFSYSHKRALLVCMEYKHHQIQLDNCMRSLVANKGSAKHISYQLQQFIGIHCTQFLRMVQCVDLMVPLTATRGSVKKFTSVVCE